MKMLSLRGVTYEAIPYFIVKCKTLQSKMSQDLNGGTEPIG